MSTLTIGCVTAKRIGKDEHYSCSNCPATEIVENYEEPGKGPKNFIFQPRLNDSCYAKCEACGKDKTVFLPAQ